MNEANPAFTDIEITPTTELAPRLTLDPALTPEALDRLVFDRGFPLTTEGVTTFAFRGDAESVQLIHFGIGLPGDLSFERLADSKWWLLALGLPDGTRLEYQIKIIEGGHEHVIEDPLNPHEARNPFGRIRSADRSATPFRRGPCTTLPPKRVHVGRSRFRARRSVVRFT